MFRKKKYIGKYENYQNVSHTFLKVKHSEKEVREALTKALKETSFYIHKELKNLILNSTPTFKYKTFGHAEAHAMGTTTEVVQEHFEYNFEQDRYIAWADTRDVEHHGYSNKDYSPYLSTTGKEEIPSGEELKSPEQNIYIEYTCDKFAEFIKNVASKAHCRGGGFGHVSKEKITFVPVYEYSCKFEKHIFTIAISASDLSVHNLKEYEQFAQIRRSRRKSLTLISVFSALIASVCFFIPYLILPTIVKFSWLWALGAIVVISWIFSCVVSNKFDCVPPWLEYSIFWFFIPFTLCFILGTHFAPNVKISSGEELKYIRNYNFANFELMQDIDMSGIEYKSVNNFWGTLDGNNYKIKNTSISGRGFVKNLHGTIKNIHFENFAVEYFGMKSAGAIAGTMHSGLIENCSITQTHPAYKITLRTMEDSNMILGFVGLERPIYHGGLVGYQKGGNIKNISIDSVIEFKIDEEMEKSYKIHNGGIVGYKKETAILENYDISNINFIPESLNNLNEESAIYTELNEDGYINQRKVIGNLK